MSYLNLKPEWNEGVYQLEEQDPVMEGPDGVDNKPLKDLGDRTEYLKPFTDEIKDARGEYESLEKRLVAYDNFDPETAATVKALAEQAAEEVHIHSAFSQALR